MQMSDFTALLTARVGTGQLLQCFVNQAGKLGQFFTNERKIFCETLEQCAHAHLFSHPFFEKGLCGFP